MTAFVSRRLLIVLSLLTLALVAIVLVELSPTPVGSMAAVASAPTTTGEAIESAEARAFTTRGGIGNAATKLKAGAGEVTVAFIGGPITAGDTTREYPQLVTRWLTSQFPGARLKLVNAGLVDGGSALGAARLDRDVLHHRPDLLFVEFAVDDEASPSTRGVERILRKVWTADPRTDVVFLYAISERRLPDYLAGKLPPAASAHERVANHYGVPSIAMGSDVAQQVQAGKTRWVQLFNDEWRPAPAGHTAYADAVNLALREMFQDSSAGTAQEHQLPAPLNPGLINVSRGAATRPAKPMTEPPPLTDSNGREARVTYVMPRSGVNWVGEPAFKDAQGRVLWRLLTQSASANGRRMMSDFGLDRSRWGKPMRWFNEYGYFTGPAGVYLVYGSPGDAPLNNFAAREDDLPVIVFTAPQAGRYLVRVKSAGMTIWGLHRALAMNVVHFPTGQDKGRSLAFHRTQAGMADALNLSADVTVAAAGDEIAFELDTNAVGGGGGAVFKDVEITVAWFGE